MVSWQCFGWLKKNRPITLDAAVPVWCCLFFLWSFSGCTALSGGLKAPGVVFENLQATDASLLESRWVFNLRVDNPNPVPLRTGASNYALKINGIPFLQGDFDGGVKLPVQGNGSIKIPLDVNYLDLFHSVAEMVHQRSIAYDLAGTCDIGPFTLPISARGTFELPQMPLIYLQEVTVEDLAATHADLKCGLMVDNPNGFALNFKRLDVQLSLGGVPLARTAVQVPASIDEKARTKLDLDMRVSFADIGRSALDILNRSDCDYQMDGFLVMTTRTGGDRLIPYSVGGRAAVAPKP